LGRLLGGPSIVNAEALQVALAEAPEVVDVLGMLLERGLQIGFLVALLITIFEVISRIYQFIRDYRLWIVIKPKQAN